MSEQRNTQRRRMLKGARIVFNEAQSTIDCVVRDLSDTGAKLQVASPVGIPDEIGLLLDDGRRFEARVVWRRSGQIGVTFVT